MATYNVYLNAVRGVNYYIDATLGDDDNAGTYSAPWATLAKAIASADAGSNVYVRAGTYAEQAKFTKALNIIGYPGELPVIDGTSVSMSPSYSGLLDFQGTSGTHLDGVTIKNVKIIEANTNGTDGVYNAVYMRYVDNIVIEDIETDDARDSGIMLRNCITFRINGNLIKNCAHTAANMDESISISNSTDGEIYGNEVHSADINPMDPCSIGICVKEATARVYIYNNHIHDMDSVGIYVCGWSVGQTLEDIYVYNNTVHDCVYGYVINSEDGALVQRIWVYNNLAYRINKVGLAIENTLENGERKDIYVCNNTLAKALETYYSAMLISTSNLSGTILVRNNICYWDDPTRSINWMLGQIRVLTAALAKCTIDHNIVWGENDYQTDLSDGCPEADDAGESTWDDPEFTDWANDDYTLGATSPCIGAGASWTGQPSTDILGNPRVVGTIDVGCYERQ